MALVAVGGYGRRELAPCSDLDVVLVHDATVDPGELAAHLWYPLWDSGWKVDHSVRSLPQMLEAATDLKVALGLLDVRHVAGDPGITLRLRTTMLADWRRQARLRLPALRQLVQRRHEVLGELAHVSVPDLKESQGGLRDAGVLKALEATWLVDAVTPGLETARRALLDVRDELHGLTGRAGDRVAPEHWAPLADALGLRDAEEAQRHVRSLGRRITHLSRLAWRRAEGVLTRPTSEALRRTPALRPVAPGIALSRGEVVLDAGVRPADDATLLLRAAAEASSRDVLLSPATAARLVREGAPLPEPWPESARDALIRLLAGRGLLAVWETLEETGAVDAFLPEWERIRLLPHASSIHRFTVDRHVVETCLEAGRLIRAVSRPDLLLVAAVLHDIGKGSPLDHSAAGEPLARAIAARMGLGEIDAERIGVLVRRHLLLGQLATTRDPDDQATVDELVSHIPDATTVELLRWLTEADSRAASPQAWTGWRACLVDTLTALAMSALGAPPAGEAEPDLPSELPEPVRNDPSVVSLSLEPTAEGTCLTVVSADRTGLLADVAGALAMVRAPIRAARAWTTRVHGTDWGWSQWQVADGYLDEAAVRDRLRRVMAGESPRLPAREEALPPIVEVRPDASSTATVIEVRAADQLGTVHVVLAALADLELTVRSAHVSTMGPQAVDVFYVQEVGGVRPRDERAAAAAHAVRSALERRAG